MPPNQQAKKGVNVLSWMIDPDYQGDVGQLLYSGHNEECVWNIDFLGHLLILPCFVTMANGKLQSNPGRTTDGSDSSGIQK